MSGGCTVLPFPQVQRRRFIAKTAARLALSPAKTAERLLAAALDQQAKAMARKAIPAHLIDHESRQLESAIRAEVWRRVLLPNDVA